MQICHTRNRINTNLILDSTLRKNESFIVVFSPYIFCFHMIYFNRVQQDKRFYGCSSASNVMTETLCCVNCHELAHFCTSEIFCSHSFRTSIESKPYVHGFRLSEARAKYTFQTAVRWTIQICRKCDFQNFKDGKTILYNPAQTGPLLDPTRNRAPPVHIYASATDRSIK